VDLWKFFAIGHEHHVFCNPMSETKVDELIECFDLPTGARVIDIACGKGELLVRAARRWGCTGVGVDISPYFVADARERIATAELSDAIEIFEGNGAEFEAPPGSFDLSSCMGASWVWGGLDGTLRSLATWTRSGGLILVGEPFWRRSPSPEHLEASGFTASTFGRHAENVQTGLDLGLGFLHAIVSSADDWDRYEGLQCNAAERYALREPEDSDVGEVLTLVHKARDQYLKWGRNELGWALYLFLKAPHPI